MENGIFDNIVRFFKNVDYDRLLHNADKFLEMIKKQSVTSTKEATRMMLELYYVMVSDETSRFNKIIIGGALAYNFFPNEYFTKEDHGILGLLDNAAVLYFAYKQVKKCVTPNIQQQVDETLKSWSEFTIMKPEDQRV